MKEVRLTDYLKSQVDENGELHLTKGTVNLLLKYIAMTEDEVISLRGLLKINNHVDNE